MSNVKDFVRRLSFRSTKKSKEKKKASGNKAEVQTFASLQQLSQPLQSQSTDDDVRPLPRLHFPSPPSTQPESSTHQEVNKTGGWIFETITLSREGRGLGFTVSGGAGDDDAFSSDDQNFYVTRITEGGVAATDGRLRLGDIIVSVNGTTYEGLTHEEAIDLLRRSPEDVTMVVKRLPASVTESIVEIELTKGSKGLGFTLAGGVDDRVFPDDNGVFVTKIIVGGVADVDGRLAVGDRLISVNDVDLRDVTHEMSVSTLKSVTGKVRLVVGKAPISPEVNNNMNGGATSKQTALVPESARIAFRGQSESLFKTPMMSIDGPPSQDAAADMRSLRSSVGSRRGGGTPAERPDTNAPLPALIPRVMTEKDFASFVKEPRMITLRKRPNQGLGFNIVGGKEGHGIFISSLVAGGVADLNGELRRGDQLLAVNGVDLRNATHEDAVTALRTAGDTIRINAQYRPEEFGHFERMVRELHQSNSSSCLDINGANKAQSVKAVFIRALFDYDPAKERSQSSSGALKFSFGDILHIVLPVSSSSETAAGTDWWQARRVMPWSDTEHSAGLIPSKTRIESQQAARRKHVTSTTTSSAPETNQIESSNKKGRSFSLSRKLSFSKKEKLPTNDIPSSVASSLSYEPVVQLQVRYTRPVIILGPLKETLYDLLMTDFPDDYRGCIPHTSRPKRTGELDGTDYYFIESRDQMEQDVNRLRSPYIEAGIYNGHYYGIMTNSVRDVAKQGKHCLLDVNPEAIARLCAAALYPIAILIRPSTSTTMSNASWDKPVSEEEAKRIYLSSAKLLSNFGKYLTAAVNADTPNQVYQRVKEIIEEQSQPVIWVASSDQL